MAKVFIEETTLTNIGNAIRDKEGTSELIPVTDMATRIAAIESGGGGAEVTELSITSNGTYTAPEGIGYSPVIVNVPQDGSPPDEAFILTGDCSSLFNGNKWRWFIDMYSNQITTNNISNTNRMFNNASYENIPFQFNMSSSCDNLAYMFSYCMNLKVCPKIRNILSNPTASFNAENMIEHCSKISDFEDLFDPAELDGFSIKITGMYSVPRFPTFRYCQSLRQIPSWFYKLRISPESTVYPYSSYVWSNYGFSNCFVLDEALNLPVVRSNSDSMINSNMFTSTFNECYRLKNITFETDNGTPYVVRWANQTIDLSGFIGHTWSEANVSTGGIPHGTLVHSDATYQALKDDPNWFTNKVQYSRYNHDSAVATINSLPDTHELIESYGGTNTIKFKGASGSATDGGAINTLTEEEIAVAAAKGWTVTIV